MDESGSRLSGMFKMLGPGLLYAGAAIGVSHLVQSTRAGADFGFALVWAVVLANLLKYPFFEFGPRYAAATGKSLLDGYRDLGFGAILLFILMTFGTMFTIQAAVTVVTAGLAKEISGVDLPAWQWSAILLFICLIILGIGHYAFLDKLMKVIIVVLALTTLAALGAAFFKPGNAEVVLATPFSWNNKSHIFFLIALMGWMPAPIDISIWHSVWSLAKNREMKRSASLGEALFDFKVGYWGTLGLALCFLSLGALVVYGSGEALSPNGGEFAGQLIRIYTSNLGEWAYPVIAIAAFTTMFSTTLTCLDAFPRILRKTTQLMFPSVSQDEGNHLLYWVWILVTAVGALVILRYFMQNMRGMVDFATTLSFLTAPALALINYLVVTGKTMPSDARPGAFLRTLSVAGIVFLCGFSVYFLYVRYFL
jgi:Mn2+/Fe2+ NRAMP family transporter